MPACNHDWLASRDCGRTATGTCPTCAGAAPIADARITAVLDFGLAAANCALFDLATAIERNAIAWLELERGAAAAHIDIALALIAGYRRLRPLDSDALALLADLLPLVHVDFALSEVEYFHAITGSPGECRRGLRTFLLRPRGLVPQPGGAGAAAGDSRGALEQFAHPSVVQYAFLKRGCPA